MPSETHALSGHGYLEFTALAQQWNQLYAELTTIGPSVRFFGVTNPRKLLHAGWFGFGMSNPNNTSGSEVSRWWYLDFEKQRFPFYPTLYSERLVYDVNAGSVITVTTYY